MRARLAKSTDPRRIFRVALNAASAAGLVGTKRVLDSTPLYDAVATMDTITLIRSAIRGLLKVAELPLAAELRAVLTSGDDYASSAKPQVDWDDAAARAELIDSRARDGYALLAVLDGRDLEPVVTEAAVLLATVLGQDLDTGEDGMFRIARRVAKDRIISTVDPQTRHGHKTQAGGFDGYKGHLAVDPGSEIITDTEVSAGNVGDAKVAADLIDGGGDDAGGSVVYSDSAYGSGEFQDTLAGNDIASRCKTPPPTAPAGRFAKDQFDIDLDRDVVSCPAGQSAPIRRGAKGDGIAYFGDVCLDCQLRAQCTNSKGGRTTAVGRHERRLADARQQQQDPAWLADYRATRPKVERKLGHLMRGKHGARRARMRGRDKIDADFSLLAAAHNVARLAVLKIHSTTTGWSVATA